MSEEQFRDVLESALRGVHDDTDVAIIWADETITRLQGELARWKSLAEARRKQGRKARAKYWELQQRMQELEKEIRRTPRVKLADLEDKIMSLWPPAPSDPYRVKTLQEFRELTLPFIVLEPAAGEENDEH